MVDELVGEEYRDYLLRVRARDERNREEEAAARRAAESVGRSESPVQPTVGGRTMGKNPVGAVLAILSLAGFMAMTMLLMFGQAIIPEANRDFFNMGYGAMISFATLAIGYYIGSSKGSADKTEATNAAAQAKASFTTP
jgi:hypothetical protein